MKMGMRLASRIELVIGVVVLIMHMRMDVLRA